ncbi:Syntabulin [Merluccius polli]|uniref:Syntabulin n=1 Tax=Merluccius polli TaxID=89951 RepID=A0AA47P401_MERPO|nr:Syntabulin [Merluccius polli]
MCVARRSAATGGGSGRYFHGDASNTNTYPGRVRAAEGGPAAGTYPTTPRRQAKQAACGDNHGIRPPTPEQYLTPLQQKEVCIRHLRGRLRDNMERLQHRDCELDELRSQLSRMQEDWIEEECHRVEAQLALKDARREILHLRDAVESVKTNLGAREHDPQERGPRAPGVLQGPRPGGRSRSCGCSPASTLSRANAACARLGGDAVPPPECGAPNAAPDALGGAAQSPQSAPKHLLLEAALLSERLAPLRGHAAMSCSSTYDRLCSGGAVLPISHSCHTLSSGGCRCGGHAYLPHHHLFLHLPQEDTPPPPAAAASVPMATAAGAGAPSPVPMTTPIPIAERKPEVRSQACSPTMTWLSEEGGGDELSVISSAAAADISPSETRLFSPLSLPVHSHGAADKPAEVKTIQKEPRTYPPPPQPIERQEATVLEVEDESHGETEGADQGAEEEPAARLCHWSRYFLVDLLALAMPVVPTVAWLCRRAPRDVWTAVPIGSMLRGCCAVALHSLRRRGAARGYRPFDMNGATPI